MELTDFVGWTSKKDLCNIDVAERFSAVRFV